ncbi:MAG: UDP-2,4-diacetamido-2,4,6-trideoxy-beta-L-altropyranose hydrolase [Chloroflexi bacterium]|nr:UDP-2,4-diacetamido-2,4,6-trideoxy-beta-L-altropyranose hydrolase [Chloroflexota bacterium]
MGTVLFRVDGAQEIGMGHVMRCLALAQEMEVRGIRPVFVVVNYDDSVQRIVRRFGYAVETIPKAMGREEHVRRVVQSAKTNAARCIVTDLCYPRALADVKGYREYLAQMRAHGFFIVAIDDLNVARFSSHIVVNPNLGAESLAYERRGAPKYLLGADYFMFRKEFIDVAKVWRDIGVIGRKVLVTMGGTDSHGVTLAVARALARPDMPPDLDVRILMGVIFPDAVERGLKTIAEASKAPIRLYGEVDNVAAHMLWADVAITSGGLTKYETAVTGTPSIIISQVESQMQVSERFAREGSALNLGLGAELSDDYLARVVKDLLGDHGARTKMSESGKRLMDGRGCERVVSEIPAEVLR